MTSNPDAHELEPTDLAADPGEGIEMLLLSAILYARGPVVRRIAAALQPGDFHNPTHAALFTVIADLITAGDPHDSAMVLNRIQRDGKGHGHAGGLLAHALTTATVAGAAAEAVEAYADALLSQSYRRTFRAAAQKLATIANEAAEDQLYEQLCVIGRQQRDATDRLNAFRNAH